MRSSLLYFFVVGVLLSGKVFPGAAHPASSSREDESTIQEFLENRENIKIIENVLVGMERLLAENLFKLYNKINSLTLVSTHLLQEGGNMPVAKGHHNDMSNRCPEGFVAVPGDRNCYYFSTYKQPWMLARETCLQLGSSVDMLSIETTKQQFIVTHLIQSDPDTRHVKKWWTAGKGTGLYWAWHQRLSIEGFFFKFFETDSDQEEVGRNSCMVLDATYYYQWKRVGCNGDHGHRVASDRESEHSLPSHHFICQTPALKPSSVEEEAQILPLSNLLENLDLLTSTATTSPTTASTTPASTTQASMTPASTTPASTTPASTTPASTAAAEESVISTDSSIVVEGSVEASPESSTL